MKVVITTVSGATYSITEKKGKLEVKREGGGPASIRDFPPFPVATIRDFTGVGKMQLYLPGVAPQGYEYYSTVVKSIQIVP